ncbi:hypothetical protein ABKV19_010385 [Rosa sericea]
MSSLFSVMLRLLSSSSLTVASSMSSAAAPAYSKPLKGTKNVAMVQWKSTNLPRNLSYREYLKLKTRCESLQRTQRNLLGEDLGPLNTKELEQLERQLESSLKHVRSTKTQYMLDQLSDLQSKEHMLIEANRDLTMKLDEINSGTQLRQTWERGHAHQTMLYGTQHAQTQGLMFQPLDCNPTLQIGYNAVGSQQMTAATPAPTQPVNGFIPGWML